MSLVGLLISAIRIHSVRIMEETMQTFKQQAAVRTFFVVCFPGHVALLLDFIHPYARSKQESFGVITEANHRSV